MNLEGDDTLYERMPPQEGAVLQTEAHSDQSSRLVFFNPPAEASQYSICVKVRDQLRDTFAQGEFTVEVMDP